MAQNKKGKNPIFTPMTLDEYKTLNEFEQAVVLETKAKHLHTINYKKNLVTLYSVGDFYVEIHWSFEKKDVVKEVAHKDERKLNKFSKTFRLPDDLI